MANNSHNKDLERIQHAAPVDLYDDSHGLFGELLPPELVLQGLQHKHAKMEGDNFVGKLDDPNNAALKATQALHSFTCHSSQEEIMIQFDNMTQCALQVRWLDEYGRTFDHYNFSMEAFSQTVRYSRLGHLFLITALLQKNDDDDMHHGNPQQQQDEEELLLGAYRIRMPLPSGSPHYIRMEQQRQQQTEEVTLSSAALAAAAPTAAAAAEEEIPPASNSENNTDTDDTTKAAAAAAAEASTAYLFLLEAVISDPTGQDDLVVAAEALDSVGAGPNHQHLAKTIKTLATIVRNLLDHPDEAKYHTLRLSNPKVQSQIANCWGAMHLLHTIGFQHQQQPTKQNDNAKDDNNHDNGDHLTWTPDNTNNTNNLQKVQRAIKLVQQLQQRSQPGFVAELATLPPPWQGPVLSSSHSNRGEFGHNTQRGFLSDDEKWQRAERNRQRRGRSGRRPDPGNAPSSNGRWGR